MAACANAQQQRCTPAVADSLHFYVIHEIITHYIASAEIFISDVPSSREIKITFAIDDISHIILS